MTSSGTVAWADDRSCRLFGFLPGTLAGAQFEELLLLAGDGEAAGGEGPDPAASPDPGLVVMLRHRGSDSQPTTPPAIGGRSAGGALDVYSVTPGEGSRSSLYRRVIDAVSDGIVVHNSAGRIIRGNSSAERIFGLPMAEILGRTWSELVLRPVRLDGTPFPDSNYPGQLTIRTGRSSQDAAIGVHRPDGELRWVSVKAEPLTVDGAPSARSERTSGVVCTFADVTEQLEVERLKSQFVSVVSHELRTPLTCIRGALGLSVGELPDEAPPKLARLLELANVNADRLAKLVDDILDIERSDSGLSSLALRQADAAALVEQSVETMETMAERAGVVLVAGTTSNCWLWVDPDRIIQALVNLISNAIKFSPPGGVVRVSVEHEGTEARFTVSDQGRGVPAKMMKTIFERFQQADASDSREKGGTGLGLAICKSIAAQHGGEVSVRSEVGEGSTFTISLPALASSGGADGEEATADGPTILLCSVEANQLRDETLQVLFDEAGCRALAVDNVEQAIGIGLEQSPDAMVLDLGATDSVVRDEIGRLTAHPAIADIPVVMVVRSHTTEQESVEFSMRTRRIDPEALVKRIVDLLAQTAADRTAGND